MRVLHVYSGNLYGGIEAILTTIARAQAGGTARHEFALCFEGRLSAELARAGAPVHPLAPVRLSRPQTARAARGALAALLARERFDRVICHAPWSQSIFGGIARRAGVPLVFWAHDVVTGRHWTERLARRVAPDLVVANSAFTAATLPALYPSTASVVVYAPVEFPAPRSDADRRVLRRSLDTPDGAVVIVQASRAEAWKGHTLLVEALAMMRDVPRWIWWQAGGAQRPAEADFIHSVRRAAERAGIDARVRWLGQRDDVPALFSAADLYAQANISPEPFGVVFVEALAAGLPVVSTNMGGVREIVDASCGALVAPDPASLAAALTSFVTHDDERFRVGAAGPAHARALCDPAVTLAALTSSLERMTGAEAHA